MAQGDTDRFLATLNQVGESLLRNRMLEDQRKDKTRAQKLQDDMLEERRKDAAMREVDRSNAREQQNSNAAARRTAIIDKGLSDDSEANMKHDIALTKIEADMEKERLKSDKPGKEESLKTTFFHEPTGTYLDFNGPSSTLEKTMENWKKLYPGNIVPANKPEDKLVKYYRVSKELVDANGTKHGNVTAYIPPEKYPEWIANQHNFIQTVGGAKTPPATAAAAPVQAPPIAPPAPPVQASPFKSADQVKEAVLGGKLSREDGMKVLRQQFGMQ